MCILLRFKLKLVIYENLGLDCNRQYLFTMDKFVQKWRVGSQKPQTIQKQKSPLKDHSSNVAEIRQCKVFQLIPYEVLCIQAFYFPIQ